MSTATAAPGAHAASGPAAIVATAAPLTHCDNCGAALRGRFCGECGQRREPPVHSLWHFAKVATEDLTHADSRLWRTLAALLFRPGRLTAEFLAGRRARYLPPVRLYLVLSVAFFLCASATQPELRLAQLDDQYSGVARTPQQGAQHCQIEYDGPWAATIQPLAARACRRVAEDRGRSLQEAMLHNLPRAMFLFLPLLAAVMMLMYWRPRHYYVEHLLLFVHNHAFVFLAVMLAWGLGKLLPFAAGWLSFALWLYVPWYVYQSMRVVYGQGRWLTIAKLVVLCFFYLVSGALMIAVTTVYSVLTL
jgi:hypothetical protein